MTDDVHIPPSRYLRRNATDVIRQESRKALSAHGPGFDGTLAFLQPVGESDWTDAASDADDGGEEYVNVPEWWDEDKYRITQADVDRGYFEYDLTYVPVENSLQGAWGALIQSKADFGLDSDGTVRWALGGHERPGDLFHFHYQYEEPNEAEDRPEYQILVPAHVGSAGVEGNSLNSTYNLLPAGTKIGDLVVVAAMNGNADVHLNDPRFTYAGPANGGKVWYGRMTTLDPVPLQFIDSSSGNNWSCGSMTVFRGAEGQAPHFVPGAPTYFSGWGTTGLLPAVSGGVSGGICVYLARDGIGGVYGDQSWSRSPGWSLKTAYDYSYCEIDVALTTNSPNPAALTPNTDDGSYAGYVFEIRGYLL